MFLGIFYAAFIFLGIYGVSRLFFGRATSLAICFWFLMTFIIIILSFFSGFLIQLSIDWSYASTIHILPTVMDYYWEFADKYNELWTLFPVPYVGVAQLCVWWYQILTENTCLPLVITNIIGIITIFNMTIALIRFHLLTDSPL